MKLLELPRRSGILLHITSLPGGPFTGDLGPSAYAFADFLAEAGQAWWQTLPLNPIGEGSSPYSSIASFATESLMVSPELLVEDGLLDAESLDGVPRASTDCKASFAASQLLRASLLRRAYEAFLKRPASFSPALADFRAREQAWLDDYCLFAAFCEHFGTCNWTRWPDEIVKHEKSALAAAAAELEQETDYLAFQQFLFDRQWQALKSYCHERGLGMIGDIPMFVSHESADVWAHQQAFLLEDNGLPEFVAGAPPDAFAAQGQRWGNALYDWAYHEQTGFRWWNERLTRQLELFDVLRLDHFIGFKRYWRIPRTAESAMDGCWIPAPGEALFDELVKVHGDLPLIAEDLGSVTQEVWDLRDRYQLPGMKVLQFGFDGGDDNVHRLNNYPARSVAYTGTHDSDTTLGWYKALKSRAHDGDPSAEAELRNVHERLGTWDEAEIAAAAIRALYTSPANTVILPLQDVLNLDGGHRMNTPGTSRDNWTWRLKEGEISAAVAGRLRELAESSDRR